jgi:hypothetical protein
MKVDFPDPEGPTRKTNSPFEISMLMSTRAFTSPRYTLETCSVLIMDVALAGPAQVGPP